MSTIAVFPATRQPVHLPFAGADTVAAAIISEKHLAALACALGAADFGGPLSRQERDLCTEAGAVAIASDLVAAAAQAIRVGGDPLGEAFCTLRTGEARRGVGAYYTPAPLVTAMVDWLFATPVDRVIDPGAGSGRFAAAVARRQPGLPIIAIDADPLATLMTRAALAVLNANATVVHCDYLTFERPHCVGVTGFVGNPPYVRHHDLSAGAKDWAMNAARSLGISVSGLAGLHVLFYMATALLLHAGDVGCFVTSAEWLDVGYGQMLRRLLTDRLALTSLALVAPDADQVFADALTTALVAGFRAGSPSGPVAVQLARSVMAINMTDRSTTITTNTLATTTRWGPLLRGESVPAATQARTLGAIARVHRGIATGANDFFVLTRERARTLGVLPWCRPAITRAEEILAASGVVRDTPDRRLILMVPADIERAAHPQLDTYLKQGEDRMRGKNGEKPRVAQTYLASHRKPWWYLGPPKVPPMVASYMARQAPMFAYNPDGLVLLNVAHGIYPHAPMVETQVCNLIRQLNETRESFRGQGRTYHGGLEKFEPREMESLLIVDELDDGTA